MNWLFNKKNLIQNILSLIFILEMLLILVVGYYYWQWQSWSKFNLLIVAGLISVESIRNVVIFFYKRTFKALGFFVYLFSLLIGLLYTIFFRPEISLSAVGFYIIINFIGYLGLYFFWEVFKNKAWGQEFFRNFFKVFKFEEKQADILSVITFLFGLCGWGIMYYMFFKYNNFPIFADNPSEARYLHFNGPYTNGLVRYFFRIGILLNITALNIATFLLLRYKIKLFSILLIILNYLLGMSAIFISGLRGEVIGLLFFAYSIVLLQDNTIFSMIKRILLITLIFMGLIMSMTLMRQKQFWFKSNPGLEITKLKQEPKPSTPPNKEEIKESKHNKPDKKNVIFRRIFNKKHIPLLMYMFAPETAENAWLLLEFKKQGYSYTYGFTFLSDVLQFIPSSLFKLRQKYDWGRLTLSLLDQEHNKSCGGIRSGDITRSYINGGIYLVIIWSILVAFVYTRIEIINKHFSKDIMSTYVFSLLPLFLIMGSSLIINIYAMGGSLILGKWVVKCLGK